MARIRTIKPEFWSSEQVMECSPMARLLFIGMWNFCDDGGRHRASLKTIKAEVFPSDSMSTDEVAKLVLDLTVNGLITEYEVKGEKYWQVTGWKHQRIDKPTYRYPKPVKIDDHSENGIGAIDEGYERECTGTEPNGVESSGMEGNVKPGSGIFNSVTKEMLSDDKALNEWFRKASSKQHRVVGSSDADRIRVFGAAERAIEEADNPAAMFVSFVKAKDFNKITQAQEDRARKRVGRIIAGAGPPNSGIAKDLRKLAAASSKQAV